MCDILDDWFGIDPAPSGPTPAQIAAQEAKKKAEEERKRLIDQAKDADRRRGTGALILAPNSTATDAEESDLAYSTAPKGKKGRIGSGGPVYN